MSDKALPALWQRYIPITLIALLFLTPIPFGSVHNIPASLLSLIAISALFWTVLSKRCASLLQLDEHTKPGSLVLLLLFLLCIYATAQAFILASTQPASPLINSPLATEASLSYRLFASLRLTSGYTCFLALFATTLAVCRYKRSNALMINRCILLIGIIVALIGLSHWFSDNGKLFGVFEPRFVFKSHRARWPFVNPNHLGHYLLIPFFVATGTLLRLNEALGDSLNRNRRRSDFSLASFLSRSRTQTKLFRIGLYFCWIALLFIAILSTLSRSTWLGLVFGSVLILLSKRALPSSSQISPSESKTPLKNTSDNSSRRTRRRRNRSKSPPGQENSAPLRLLQDAIDPARLLQLASFVTLFVAVVFLLNDRGVELVESRIEHGLTSSKSDLRFMLYADTVPLFLANPLTGVGVGNWELAFQTTMRESLANINPVYLHSDPYQMLVELGLLGASFVVALLATLLLGVWRVLNRSKSLPPELHPQLWVMLTISVGMICLCVASFLDFPFHIPAISTLAAISLGILCSLIEELYERDGLEHSSSEHSGLGA